MDMTPLLLLAAFANVFCQAPPHLCLRFARCTTCVFTEIRIINKTTTIFRLWCNQRSFLELCLLQAPAGNFYALYGDFNRPDVLAKNPNNSIEGLKNLQKLNIQLSGTYASDMVTTSFEL